MPELPEVDTVRRGIAPHITGKSIDRVIVRNRHLRWPVPARLARSITGQTVHAVTRRAKYLLLQLDTGTLIVHLGMSGSLRLVNADTPVGKHDHIDWVFAGTCLRYNDPRRFGSVHWTRQAPDQHWLIKDLGPEPLGDDFTGAWLYQRSRGRRGAVKNFIMNSHVVVGIGNIYASESLFMAGIHPNRAVGRISLPRYELLVECVREVLSDAIAAGGTTLRDFVGGDGKPGYFSISLNVYGREGEPCPGYCGASIRQRVIGQRASFFCPKCQR